MSLINDALKKAQKQRTGETPSLASLPSVGGETPHRIAKRSKPAGFDTLIIRAGVGAGIALLLVVGSYFVFRSAPEDRGQRTEVSSNQAPLPAVAQQTAGQTPGSQQGTTVPAPSSSTPTAPAPSSVLRPPSSVQQPAAAAAPAFTLPVAQVPAPSSQAQVPSSEPQVSGFRSQVSAPPAPVVPAPTGSDPRVSPFSPPSQASRTPDPKPQTPVSAGAALKLEPRAIQYIENIKVAGIMARPTDSKVLMNDRVYRIGSLVEAEMGLTLVGITPNSLTFEDGHGARYTRTF